MNDFTLHPTLAADCHVLGGWRDIRLLLHRDAQVRWFILVPETSAGDWHELPGGLRDRLVAASSALSAMLRSDFTCDKVNVAAIGNLVPQFHFHVIGRWRSDPYWPGVVWGRVVPGCVYTDGEIGRVKERALECLQGSGA
ncbi:diadenosine tetraphosphate (Ap4A) HIT family hydrolase [Desulfomicrobium macestii]|uniref:Diadenosine tetraphosphate (Ap4A) HIT family hydrolase n=1 Tax=Desulfomicrobium macestii TaxID=90731 RepID=A0ABR9H116_9BACT|nr:HIT family protein [Desulfomicrobium macestii]MBE1424396.1 diadenosine tetraphosphate (Ap4A) HIT family hydrolase [Desulfomicrobium macestii]